MVFDTRTLEMIAYTRKVWAPFVLSQTRAATIETACTHTRTHPKPRRTALVLFDQFEYWDQREEFALNHHASNCACDICTCDRQMRAESYELEYEVGMAAHYEAMEMLEDERRHNEEEEAADEFEISDEDWAEIRARNEERGTAYGWWY